MLMSDVTRQLYVLLQYYCFLVVKWMHSLFFITKVHNVFVRNREEELSQLIPNIENMPKIWHVYYRKRFKKNRGD